MRVLITGNLGYIGSVLTSKIDRNKYYSIKTGVSVLKKINEIYPNSLIIKETRLNKLWGSNTLLEKLQEKPISYNFFAAGGITIFFLLIAMIN